MQGRWHSNLFGRIFTKYYICNCSYNLIGDHDKRLICSKILSKRLQQLRQSHPFRILSYNLASENINSTFHNTKQHSLQTFPRSTIISSSPLSILYFPLTFSVFIFRVNYEKGYAFSDILSSANKRGSPLTILLISTLINSSGAPI